MTKINLTYSEQLAHPLWQKKKAEVMARDGFKCVRCGSGERTLQVHHKEYKKRRMAWQYDLNDLETLCWQCHRKEHFDKPIAPAKQWEGIIENTQTPTQQKILMLQERLKDPLPDDHQEEILSHIIRLQKEVRNG